MTRCSSVRSLARDNETAQTEDPGLRRSSACLSWLGLLLSSFFYLTLQVGTSLLVLGRTPTLNLSCLRSTRICSSAPLFTVVSSFQVLFLNLYWHSHPPSLNLLDQQSDLLAPWRVASALVVKVFTGTSRCRVALLGIYYTTTQTQATPSGLESPTASLDPKILPKMLQSCTSLSYKKTMRLTITVPFGKVMNLTVIQADGEVGKNLSLW